MKKIIIILFMLTSYMLLTQKEEIIIPEESIRFRIIANSNTLEDQAFKTKIKENLMQEIIPKIEKLSTNYTKSQEIVKKTIPTIEQELNKYNIDYNINYGQNHFPIKEYKGIIYPEGDYNSLVITLGKGLGDNFWCVLYPPLCLAEQKQNISDIEYKSLFQEILNKN